MSLECIEGAYAACLGDKRITGTQMATLICLCWHANPKSRECFPSTERISQMTHFGTTAVEEARRRLRELGLIDWLPGGQDATGKLTNRYYFKFPMQKMRDVARSRYETALERHQAVDNSKYPPYTPPASRGEGPRLAGGGYPVWRGGIPRHAGTKGKRK